MITFPQESANLESLVASATNAYLDRAGRGESVNIDEFIRAYPPVADVLRQLLPALRAMQTPAPELPPAASQTLVNPMTDSAGCLGDFRLIREIGRGGMGIVYQAEQKSLNRQVALKVLPLAAALDPRQLQRFSWEAKAAACLNHPHIVPIYSVGSERGIYYYAMQFVEGHSLADVIYQPLKLNQNEAPVITPPTVIIGLETEPDRANESGSEMRQAQARTLPFIQTRSYFQRIVTIGIQVAEALDYAHGMGVVHRDVKPANLLLDAQGNVFVTDFGLAQLRGVSGLTMTGDLVGTLRYMSPEQVLARRGVVDHRTDVYALGATLYELLTLTPAFDALDRNVLLRQIAEEEPVPPRHRNPALPVDLETIVLKAMAKEPEKRYATAQELADDLRRFQEDRPIEARRPTLLELVAKWSRRHRSLVSSAAGLLVLATVGFGIYTVRITNEQALTKKALEEREQALVEKEKALQEEEAQRTRADELFHQAREEVDAFFALCEKELANKPELQGLRRKMLESVLAYYQNFINQSEDDPSLQADLAATHFRVGMILNEIGSQTEALASLNRARQMGERLVREHPTVPEFQNTLSCIYKGFGSVQGGRDLYLLAQPAVQTEVKLTPEQSKTVEQLNGKRRDLFAKTRNLSHEEWRAEFEDLSTQEKAILQPDQTKRLRQISLQQRGGDAFYDPAVALALQLTREQKSKIHALQEAKYRSAMEGFHRPGFSFAGQGKRPTAKPTPILDKILAVLTEEQKAQWGEMIGTPFKGEIRPAPPSPFSHEMLMAGMRAFAARSHQYPTASKDKKKEGGEYRPIPWSMPPKKR